MFVLIKIIELLVGIGGGAAFEFIYHDASRGLGFIVALLLFILWELIEASRHAKGNYDCLRTTLAMLTEAEARMSAKEPLLQLGLTYAGRGEISKPETADVWNRLTWAAQSSYKAIGITSISETFMRTDTLKTCSQSKKPRYGH